MDIVSSFVSDKIKLLLQSSLSDNFKNDYSHWDRQMTFIWIIETETFQSLELFVLKQNLCWKVDD